MHLIFIFLLQGIFLKGLSGEMKDRLAASGESSRLEELISSCLLRLLSQGKIQRDPRFPAPTPELQPLHLLSHHLLLPW